MGIIGKLEAGAGIATIVVIGGTAYYVYKNLPVWFPNGLGAGLGDWFTNFWDGIWGGGSNIHMIFSKDSAKQGEVVGLAVDGLKPSTPFLYGWRELNYSDQFMSLPDGTWYGEGGITIANTTPPGTYTVFIDQRQWGGPRYETRFTVLRDDAPPPPDNVPYRLELRAADYSVSMTEKFALSVQLFNQYSEPAKAARNINFSVNANVIATRATSSTTGALTLNLPASLLGGAPGTYRMYATMTPTGDNPIQDDRELTVL